MPREEEEEDTEDSLQNIATELRRLTEINSSDSPTTLKAEIFKGSTRKRSLPLTKLELEYQVLYRLFKQIVLAGKGNSVMILGSRGTGEKSMVETVIKELACDYQDVLHVIRINGFIHTDDKLVLRENRPQFGREVEAEDDNMSTKG